MELVLFDVDTTFVNNTNVKKNLLAKVKGEKMNKALLIVLSLLVTGSAFASKARLNALGDDKDGSFFIDDFRNMFLNAAYIHNHKDNVFLEFGDNGTSTANIDSDADQKAMGGFLKSSGNFVYGLYLGNESDTDNLLRATAWISGAGAADLNPVDNVTDFFFGGETGDIKWGANILYSKSEDESAKREDERYALRLGMMMGDIEAFANISLGNEAKDSDAGTGSTELKFDGKTGYHIGGAYRLGDFTPYVSFKDGSWDNKNGTTSTEGTFTEIKVGVGHIQEVNATSRIFTRLNYFSESVELKYASSPAKAELKTVPLTIGFESDATNWLTLRGSVSTNLMGTRKTTNLTTNQTSPSTIGLLRARYNGGAAVSGNKDETIQDATNISAGATLKLGKLSIDGLIGTTGIAGTSGNSEVGTLALDRLMTRVAMTYSF